MSQYWHGHWTNDSFKPIRLQNWEVPNWHPCWPDQHCRETQFMADDRGHILTGKKRSTVSPWGYFKGTWELPTKISRQMAYELSAPPKHKINAWKQHKRINKKICESKNIKKSAGKLNVHPTPMYQTQNDAKSDVSEKSEPKLSLQAPRIAEMSPKTPCPIHDICQI